MGNPIMRNDPGPLPLFKGYFVAHVTPHEVGSYPPDVFVRQQRGASQAFTPLVSLEGGTLDPAWAGQRLHWLYGGIGEGGAFFRVHSSGQLEYLGTSHHPSPAWLNFPEDSGGEPVERHVSPGYVLYQEQDGDEGSTDSEGYHDSPAVFVGGEPTTVAPADRPSCLRCLNGMHFIGHADCSLFCDDLVAVMLLFYCQDCRIQCCMDHPS